MTQTLYAHMNKRKLLTIIFILCMYFYLHYPQSQAAEEKQFHKSKALLSNSWLMDAKVRIQTKVLSAQLLSLSSSS
jgi:hypothetical protein